MLFEWDTAKNDRNVRLRGISFDIVERLDWNTALILESTREQDREPRFKVLGLVGDVLHTVIYTPRPPALRIISVRIASRKERAFYASQTEPASDR